MYLEKLRKKLVKLEKKRDELLNDHYGNESNYTYWGGHSLGYIKGQIVEIEDFIAELDERSISI